MSTIRILIIGESKWINQFKTDVLVSLQSDFETETISELKAAQDRLSHNSYDILILQNRFKKTDSVELASLAFAMTRPSIIICQNILSLIICKFYKMFSRFFNKYKISRKLIYFNLNNSSVNKKILSLSKDYKKFYNMVNEEISKETKL